MKFQNHPIFGKSERGNILPRDLSRVVGRLGNALAELGQVGVGFGSPVVGSYPLSLLRRDIPNSSFPCGGSVRPIVHFFSSSFPPLLLVVAIPNHFFL